MRTLVRYMLVAAILALPAVTAAAEARRAGPRPDLVVTSVSKLPFEATGGRTIRLRDSVRNRGRRTARATRTVYYLSLDTRKDASDHELKQARAVPRLKRRRHNSGVARLVMPDNATGLFRIIACADATGRVREASERNNCRAAPGEIFLRIP